MPFIKRLVYITGHILFVITLIFFSTLQAKNLEKYNNAENIADYFSGVVLLNQSQYDESYKYFKRLDGLEKNHTAFSSKYLYSLINSGKFNEAFNFSKKIEKEKKDSFESDLIIGIYYLKNSQSDISKKYFLKAKQRNSRTFIDNYVANTLYIWSDFKNSDLEQATFLLDKLDPRFKNLKKYKCLFKLFF